MLVAISAIMARLFLGGWWMFRLDEIVPGWMIFIGKIYFVYFLSFGLRGTLPRFRIDQLLRLRLEVDDADGLPEHRAGRR